MNINKSFDYENEISYGRKGNQFFVKSLNYEDLIAFSDESLLDAFKKYFEEYHPGAVAQWLK